MKRRLFTFFAAICLLASAFTAPPTHAVTNMNLAGRPTNGSAYESCQGLAYGRVDNKLVLFIANHCQGVPPIAPDGTQFGNWGGTEGSDYDLSYVYLNPGYLPTNPQQIFKGNGLWWTISQRWTWSNYACLNLANAIGSTVYQNFQSTSSSNTLARTGHITGFTNGVTGKYCQVQTDLPQHTGGLKDSGSSLILYGAAAQVFAVATQAPNSLLSFTPAYGGIYAIRAYWLAHGSGVGAWFCVDATCSGP
jgi:hypothetical protein